MNPKYKDQNSTQTLTEALNEYYELNKDIVYKPETLPEDIAEMFRYVGHVLFGCDTSLRDETLVDTWTVFGTTAGVRGYLEYFKYPEVQNVFSGIGYWKIAIEFIRCVPEIIIVAWRSFKLNTKWAWKNYHAYLNVPLWKIREEFNIAIL